MDGGCIQGYDFAIIEMENDLMVSQYNDTVKLKSYPSLHNTTISKKIS